ncbi:putative uncharacterized protein encoded by LINC00526 [Piliocolobus tephrosceles]|uniref:putative uncharacterized protein encoded by LINC00526 n=1 Tax=Piliocolobus tephrosceles TaxID=591936 RepID=UPI000C29D92E|nr:putative uncharacterized protein encoded by LINC00526 [Piliocolobus tephrosceles]
MDYFGRLPPRQDANRMTGPVQESSCHSRSAPLRAGRPTAHIIRNLSEIDADLFSEGKSAAYTDIGASKLVNNGRQLAECQVFQDELKLRVVGRLDRWERPVSR